MLLGRHNTLLEEKKVLVGRQKADQPVAQAIVTLMLSPILAQSSS